MHAHIPYGPNRHGLHFGDLPSLGIGRSVRRYGDRPCVNRLAWYFLKVKAIQEATDGDPDVYFADFPAQANLAACGPSQQSKKGLGRTEHSCLG